MKRRQLISFDWALKRLLRSKANFEILEGFLSELLMEDVRIQEILESESNQEDRLDKYNRVDMKVKNGRDELILIELQYEREFDYLQRILYGISKTITEHLDEGKPYSDIPKVISISILYFDIGQGADYIYHGTTSFRGLHTNDELALSEGQKDLFCRRTIQDIFPEYYLIKVNRFNDMARDTLDEWVYFLKNGEIRDDFTARGLIKAKEQLDLLKLPAPERQAYERYQDDLHFQASMVESTYGVGKLEGRKEGIQEGIQKGIQEGIQKGIQEGLQKGLQKGEQQGEAKMLMRLLQRRFGTLPDWANQKIAMADASSLEAWGLRLMEVPSLEALFADPA